MKHLLITAVLSLSAVSVRAQGWEFIEVPFPARTYATETDRAARRPMGQTPNIAVPPVVRDAIKNGMKLSLIEMHRLPLASVKIVFPYAGSATVDADKEGLAGLTTAMMTEGTKRLPDRVQFAEAIADLGGSVGISVDEDKLIVSITSLKKNLDKAMGLASEIVREPAFLDGGQNTEQALARLKQESLQSIKMAKGDPSKKAGKLLAQRIYPDHPYGRSESEESISSVDSEDVRNFHRRGLRPEGAIIAAAGDLDMAELKSLADKHFGDWTGTKAFASVRKAAGKAATAAAPKIAEAGAVPEKAVDWKIDLVDSPGATQSSLRLGHRSVSRSHPDYYAIQVMSRVLGSGAVGRIEANIREDKNWAYGARSSFDMRKTAGSFVATTEVQTDKTAPAIQEIMKEIRRIQNEPVPDEELAAVKRFMVGLFLRSNRTVQGVSDMVAGLEANGLSADTLSKWVENVQQITPAQVQAAAQKHLRYETIHMVVAGDASKIYESLSKVAPVRVLDLDGNEKKDFSGPKKDAS